MRESTLAGVKKIQLLLFVVVIAMLFFGGCGGQEAEDGARLEHMAVSLSGGVDISTMGTEAWQESQALSRAEDGNGTGTAAGDGNSGAAGNQAGTAGAGNPGAAGNQAGTPGAETPRMALNDSEATVTYKGLDYVSSYRTIGGDSIYCTGFEGTVPEEGPYFAGRIGMEEDTIQQFSLEIPKGMFVYRGCTDSQGRWHLLLSQKNGSTVQADQKTEIWIVNRDGELEQSFDITEYVGESWFCIWMAVDQEGVYYFALNGGLRVIDTAAQTVATLNFGGEILGIGIGRSGALYGMFNVEGNNFLGRIDTGSGSVEKCADLAETLNSSFSILQGGANTELLLANKGNGVWSYDGEELKQELVFSDIMASGQDILAIGFLWDGRMCVMSREGGRDVFRYIPVED